MSDSIYMMDAPPGHDFDAIGYAPMQQLYREGQALLQMLAEPATVDYGLALVAIHEHLLRQCSAEEGWMRQADFPGYERHKREHDMLLEVVSEVRRRYDAGDNEIVERLAAELPQWFEEHTQSMDAPLAQFLKERARPPVAEEEAELA